MNLQQDVCPSSLKKNPLAKISLAIFLSLTLLAAALSFHTPQTHAATISANSADANASISIIHNVFGPYAGQAIRVATCESGLNPNATNSAPIGGSHAAGLFQILYPSTWYGTSQAGASPYDPQANAQAAYQIFQRDGYSWREWQCQP